ncbi:MAG: hypothetical protein ABIT76_08830 [Chthoniobacterales bacterium]
MKLTDIANLTGNDLWKGIRGCRTHRQLDYLATRFSHDQATLDFIESRRSEIRAELSQAAQITLNIDAIVAYATGCTRLEANAALNDLQWMAEARREG